MFGFALCVLREMSFQVHRRHLDRENEPVHEGIVTVMIHRYLTVCWRKMKSHRLGVADSSVCEYLLNSFGLIDFTLACFLPLCHLCHEASASLLHLHFNSSPRKKQDTVVHDLCEICAFQFQSLFMKLVFGSCACSVYLCDNTAACCSICELQQGV